MKIDGIREEDVQELKRLGFEPVVAYAPIGSIAEEAGRLESRVKANRQRIQSALYDFLTEMERKTGLRIDDVRVFHADVREMGDDGPREVIVEVTADVRPEVRL